MPHRAFVDEKHKWLQNVYNLVKFDMNALIKLSNVKRLNSQMERTWDEEEHTMMIIQIKFSTCAGR